MLHLQRGVTRQRHAPRGEGGLHQPGAVDTPGRHSSPFVGRALEMLQRPALRRRRAGRGGRVGRRRQRRPRPARPGARRAGAPWRRPARRGRAAAGVAAGPRPEAWRRGSSRLPRAATGRRPPVGLDQVPAWTQPWYPSWSPRTRRHSPRYSSTLPVSPSTSWLTCSERRLGWAKTGAIAERTMTEGMRGGGERAVRVEPRRPAPLPRCRRPAARRPRRA